MEPAGRPRGHRFVTHGRHLAVTPVSLAWWGEMSLAELSPITQATDSETGRTKHERSPKVEDRSPNPNQQKQRRRERRKKKKERRKHRLRTRQGCSVAAAARLQCLPLHPDQEQKRMRRPLIQETPQQSTKKGGLGG